MSGETKQRKRRAHSETVERHLRVSQSLLRAAPPEDKKGRTVTLDLILLESRGDLPGDELEAAQP